MNRNNGHSGNFSDSDVPHARTHDHDRAGQAAAGRRARAASSSYNAGPSPAPEGTGRPSVAIDAWSLLRPASKRWYWLFFGGVLGGIAGLALGVALWTTHYTATAQIIRYDPPMATDAYRPMHLNGFTLVGMIKSPEIEKRLAQKRAAAGVAGGGIEATPERNSELVTVKATGIDPRSAIALANLHNTEVIEFSREYQLKEAEEADRNVIAELEGAEKELADARRALPSNMPPGAFSMLENGANGGRGAVSAASLQKLADEVESAQNRLSGLLLRYTDIHPDVKAQRALVAELETRLELKGEAARGAASAKSGSTGNGGAAAFNAPITREEWDMAYFKVRQYENHVANLRARQRAIQIFKANPPGHFKVFQSANADTVAANRPTIKIALLGIFFGLLGFVAAAGELLRRELFDTRLKTEADVTRVTGLPVLATLGDIRQMSLAAREGWAFRAWIALQDRLAYSPNHGLICGITSSNSGDGRSTWINLLAGAARKCGFRVLTIATRPTADAPAVAEEVDDSATTAAHAAGEPAVHARATRHAHAGTNGHANGNAASAVLSRPEDFSAATRGFAGDSEFTALTASALFTPAMVTEKLMGTETDPLVHIPLPGWTWNLERRKQWQGALNVWRKIDNVVILVELPPASMPESVLLASNLPNLLWLVESGKSDAADTRAQLQTLRHARCNLVGSVINRAMAPVAGGRFARWVSCLTLFAALGMAGNDLVAGEPGRPAAPAASQPGGAMFAAASPAQRAQWQQKLTLGPGDVLNLSIYGDPEYTREEVPVGPDGRISYLEAQNIMAAGLTVDELREKLNTELGRFRRAPQAFVVPVAYKSKKYFVLGKVANRGAFPLDRPMTLVEAVARAGGMETGLAADRSMVELADLSRSFIARNGQRLTVDFEKLFLQGDLSQNIPLEPNDYIYFPASGEKEVYVLGAVGAPGAYVYNNTTGALGAIAARGGFSNRAWKRKVLVIRGGLGRPETFELDATAVLTAQTPDLKLQPKDIVFVSERPWIRGEELLEAAANAFVTAAVVTWTGEKVTR